MPQFFDRDGQYAVPTHYLMGAVNIWWGHTFSDGAVIMWWGHTSFDWDRKYVVGTHIILWGQTKCLGAYNYMWDGIFFSRTYARTH